jgi:hypothetical protein
MTIDIGRFSTAPRSSDEPARTAGEGQKPPELVYGSAEEFLHEQLLPTYVRDVDGRAAKWCIEWYFHPEALSRVEALWRAWEPPTTRRGNRDQRVVQRPRGPPHERAPGPARPVLQMRHAKAPRPRTPRAEEGPGRLVPRCAGAACLTAVHDPVLRPGTGSQLTELQAGSAEEVAGGQLKLLPPLAKRNRDDGWYLAIGMQ